MRHRIVTSIGLGNPDPVRLNNKGGLHEEFANEVLETFFNGDGFDFKVTKKEVLVGIEPAYQHEKLKIICISKDKGLSFYEYGTSFGPYGSKILGKKKFYKDYKRECKFKRLVDKFHGQLFN